MAIVNSEITKDNAQADGRRKIRYRYTFHTNETRDLDRGLQPATFDANADLAAQVQRMEESQAESELNQYISDAESNLTDLTTTVPTHPLTDGESDFNKQKRLFRAALKYFYNNRDQLTPYVVSKVIIPIWNWIRQAQIDNSWTNTQVANYLGWSVAVLSRIENWVTRMEAEDVQTFLAAWYEDTDENIED